LNARGDESARPLTLVAEVRTLVAVPTLPLQTLPLLQLPSPPPPVPLALHVTAAPAPDTTLALLRAVASPARAAKRGGDV
jgi:hypothetical protein